MFAIFPLANGREAVIACSYSRDTYAAGWKILNLGEVLGECEAGEQGDGDNEELHGGSIYDG